MKRSLPPDEWMDGWMDDGMNEQTDDDRINSFARQNVPSTNEPF